ncbi:hypothetical protein KKH27_13565 [bacterium]|nr:hypothetical protein [bacterium]MBU1985255.1 hypothetical protein [bacterium]
MKRTWILVILLAFAAVYFMGCASPQQKAQQLMAAGKYEEVITQYGANPDLAGLVAEAKEKVAEKWLAEGKLQEILDTYPETKAAKEAKNMLAEKLFAEGKFQEVIDKYPGTPAAEKAKAELEKQKQEEEVKGKEKETSAKDKAAAEKERNLKAEAKLKEIMNIKVKNLRSKALKEFTENPAYKGTPAAQKAQAELKK